MPSHRSETRAELEAMCDAAEKVIPEQVKMIEDCQMIIGNLRAQVKTWQEALGIVARVRRDDY